MRTALVLSAGGMFGAFQAGAWQVLAPLVKPDLIVGTSIGALNAWIIAGDRSPEYLVDRWLNFPEAASYRWHVPRNRLQGMWDSGPIQKVIQQLYEESKPRTRYALILTELRRMQPRIFEGPQVTWRHLAAAAALIGFFDQFDIDGTVYSDGGLTTALPIWAAAQMGAERVIAINAMPKVTWTLINSALGLLNRWGGFKAEVPKKLEVIRIESPEALGGAIDALYWKREHAERWINEGRRRAEAAVREGQLAIIST